MKPAILSHFGLKAMMGVIALIGAWLYIPASSQAQTPSSDQRPTSNALPQAPSGMLMGLQTIYLRAPILRFYTEPSSSTTPGPIPREDLPLPNLAVGSNSRLYPDLDKVRATVAKDEALSAFLQDPRTGAALHQALQEVTLYACLPRQGLSGFNEYNVMNSLPGNMRPIQAGAGAGRAARPGAAFGGQPPVNGINGTAGASSTGGSDAAPGISGGATAGAGVKQPGFLGDVQSVKPQTGAAGAGGSAAGAAGARIATARRAALRDFTTMVVLSPDGRRANLYVMGSLPDSPNPAVPINLTVESKQYANGDRSADGVDHASNETLLDKQALPAAGAGTRYFCYVYPLVTPAAGIQNDVLVSYWPDTAVAVTHGAALAHTDTPQPGAPGPAAQWITIPMTRLQYYPPRRDTRYALLASVEPGDPLVDAIQARARAQIRRAANNRRASAGKSSANRGVSGPRNNNNKRNNRWP